MRIFLQTIMPIGLKTKTKNPDDKIEIEKWQELSKAYKAYDEIKTKEALMDFGDDC